MNEQPKTKFYKRPWFVLPVGMILGVAIMFVVAFFNTYPQYLSPSHWGNRVNEAANAPVVLSQSVVPTATTTPVYFEFRESDGKGGFVSTGLDSRYLINASVNSEGSPSVTITLDKQGSQLFGEITGRNIGKPVAIFVGGKLVMAPVVQQKITGSSLQIMNGSLSLEEAINLARGLNAGRGLTQNPQ